MDHHASPLSAPTRRPRPPRVARRRSGTPGWRSHARLLKCAKLDRAVATEVPAEPSTVGCGDCTCPLAPRSSLQPGRLDAQSSIRVPPLAGSNGPQHTALPGDGQALGGARGPAPVPLRSAVRARWFALEQACPPAGLSLRPLDHDHPERVDVGTGVEGHVDVRVDELIGGYRRRVEPARQVRHSLAACQLTDVLLHP